MAGLQAHCVGMDMNSEEARAVMIPVAARILAGKETQPALAKWAAVASQVEFLTNQDDGLYKETRRTMFKWKSDKPQSTFVPLQDNPQRPYRLGDGKANAFGYGENPFTQVLQHGRTMIGITRVPETYPHWKSYAPFSTGGAVLRRIEKDGSSVTGGRCCLPFAMPGRHSGKSIG